MLKNATPVKQYELLEPFIPHIIRSIRRDLRQDHLKLDTEFLKKNFGDKNPNKLKVDDLSPVYTSYLKEGNLTIWEFFTDRWLMKHREIYDFFEARLITLDEDFNELQELDPDFSEALVNDAIKRFGPLKTYIFSVLNLVVFPEHIYKKLQTAAER